MTDLATTDRLPSPARRAGGVSYLAGAAVLFSLALACATPFAALATAATFALPHRDAVFAVCLAFVANQMIGFGFLDYPRDAETIAWGAGIGVAALASLGAAMAAARPAARFGRLAAWGLSFAAAFAVWQLALFAAGQVIGTGSAGFSAEIVVWVLQLNAVALAGFAGLWALARHAGLVGAAAPKAV
jgi:hypothetical protein